MRKILALLLIITYELYGQTMSIDDAIKIALENNRALKISRNALQIAEAQYHQAISVRYPQVMAVVNISRMDEAPMMSVKGNMELSQDMTNAISYSGAVLTDKLYGTGTKYQDETVSSIQNGSLSAQTMPIDMDIKLMGRDTSIGRIELSYPLYSGGKIDAVIKQAVLNKSIQSEENRRNEVEVIYNVKKYYNAAILATKLNTEMEHLYEEMNAVRDLTKSFYMSGSIKVKKTDYLRTCIVVDFIESKKHEAESSVLLAKSALINSIGLPLDTEITLTDNDFNIPNTDYTLQEVVDKAYQFNPMYSQIKLAVDVSSAKIDEAKSDYYPSVGITANIQQLNNSYDGGLNNSVNRNSWSIGIGLQWKLFEGFRTSYAVQEAQLNKVSTEHKEVLLKEGLAYQLKSIFISMGEKKDEIDILSRTKSSVIENVDLNKRAYQAEMIDTKDLIESQMMETMTNLLYYKNLHDLLLLKSQYDYLLASKV